MPEVCLGYERKQQVVTFFVLITFRSDTETARS